MDGFNQDEAPSSLALMFRDMGSPHWLPNLLALHARDQLASKMMATQDWSEILKLANQLRVLSLSRINAKSRSHAGPRRPIDLKGKVGIDPVLCHLYVLGGVAKLKCSEREARDIVIRMFRRDLDPALTAPPAKIVQAEKDRAKIAVKLKNATDKPAKAIAAMIKALDDIGGDGILRFFESATAASREH